MEADEALLDLIQINSTVATRFSFSLDLFGVLGTHHRRGWIVGLTNWSPMGWVDGWDGIGESAAFIAFVCMFRMLSSFRLRLIPKKPSTSLLCCKGNNY